MDSTNHADQTDQRKKEWSWQKKETKCDLYTLEILQWGITTLQKHEDHLRHAMPAISLKEKCQQRIGLIKSFGQDLKDLKSRLREVRNTGKGDYHAQETHPPTEHVHY